MFKDMKRFLGQDICFREGLLKFQLDLSDIDPKHKNIIVLDDLMGGPRRRHHFKAAYARKA